MTASRFLLAALCLCAAATPALAAPPLTPVQVLRDGQKGIDGLGGAHVVTISPDGRHVYTGAGTDDVLGVWARDPRTGQLRTVELLGARRGIQGLRGVAGLSVSPDGKNVYAVSLHDHALLVFRRDAATGKLSVTQVLKRSTPGYQGLVAPASVTVSRDNVSVYVTGYVGDTFLVLRRDPKSGKVTVAQSFNGSAEGAGAPIAVAESKDGKSVYLLSARDFTLTTFEKAPRTGKLAIIGVAREGVSRVRGLGAARGVAITPDGLSAYVVGAEGTLSCFRRRETNGTLSFADSWREGRGGVEGLGGSNAIITDAAGSTLYVAAGGGPSVGVVKRDPGTALVRIEEVVRLGREGLAGARSLVLSPDGYHLYVAAADDSALVAFRVGNKARPAGGRVGMAADGRGSPKPTK